MQTHYYLPVIYFAWFFFQGLKMRCSQFMLGYNLFVSLHESAFDVEYGLADIQGNTFETMTGKPFIDLRPIPVKELMALPKTEPQV